MGHYTVRARKAKGLCYMCGNLPDLGRKTCAACRQRANRGTDRYLRGVCNRCNNPVESGRKRCDGCVSNTVRDRNKLAAKGLCKCRKPVSEGMKSCGDCRKVQRLYNRKLRDEVISAYGGYTCSCCGETQPHFLQLDHVNNDGNLDRKLRGSGSMLYTTLRKQNFPSGYQVLCANCNYAKAHYGICPHRPGVLVNPQAPYLRDQTQN